MKSVIQSIRLTSAWALIAAITFTSCKKNDAISPDDNGIDEAVSVAESNELSATAFNDVFNIALGVQADDAGEEIGIGTGAGIMYKPGSGESTLGDRCYTVSVVPKEKNVWPKTATINFGEGCVGADGKLRKGKIIIIYTKPAYLPGAKISTTFDGYAVDSFALSGTHIITNTSTDNHFGFKVEVINGKLTNTNTGFWRKYEGVHAHKQIEGMSTPFNPLDDVYKVTGSSKGGNSNGRTWMREITTPVIRKYNCAWRGAGVVTIHWNQNPNAATLDYGDGSCDNKALLTFKGHTKVITLK